MSFELKRLDVPKATSGIEEKEMLTVRINKKEAFKYIKEYSEKFPLPRHLKRVRKCPDDENTLLLLARPLSSENDPKEGEFGSVLVPWSEPMTREEWKVCNALWPCDFFHTALEKETHAHHQKMTQLLTTHNDDLDKCLVFYKDQVLSFPTQHHDTNTEDSERDCRQHLAFKLVEFVAERAVTDYLLTDCVVLLNEEPCLACAMALLHSRVETVIFSTNSLTGATVKLMQVTGLNHYYKVYQIIKDKV